MPFGCLPAPGHPAGLRCKLEGNRVVRAVRGKLVSKYSQPESGCWELFDLKQGWSELAD